MDAWLHGSARSASRTDSAAVTVCTHPDRGVIAFFALVSHQVRGADVARNDSGGLSTIPATLLARLGLLQELQGDGLGADLVVEALRLAVVAADAVGSRMVVLDAKNARLAKWYERLNFKPTKTDPLRLYMKMATARQVVASL